MAIVHATIERQMDNEIVYRIPSTELPKFSNLFENLERNSEQFQISHIGLTCDTIEHVLMRYVKYFTEYCNIIIFLQNTTCVFFYAEQEVYQVTFRSYLKVFQEFWEANMIQVSIK